VVTVTRQLFSLGISNCGWNKHLWLWEKQTKETSWQFSSDITPVTAEHSSIPSYSLPWVCWFSLSGNSIAELCQILHLNWRKHQFNTKD
jgi:hypothetical protein